MNQTLIQHVQKKFLKNTPDIKPGYTVRVHQKIKEGGKERVQIFEGLVIKVQGEKGTHKTMTVRKVVSGVGVEKIFPLHSNNIEKIEIKKKAKVRRAKLYYMRERSGKSARLKEDHVDEVTVLENLHSDLPEQAEVAEETNSEDVQTSSQSESSVEAEESATEEVAPNDESNKVSEEVSETEPSEEDKA